MPKRFLPEQPGDQNLITVRNFRDLQLVSNSVEDFLADRQMRWAGAYPEGVPANAWDVVRDGDWLMIANKPTDDRPAPQPIGDPFFVYEGANPTEQITAKQIIFGTRYTAPTGFAIEGYRVYTVIGNSYRVFSESGGKFTEILSFTGQVSGWQEFALSVLVPAGLTFTLYIAVSEPAPTPTTFTLVMDYQTPQNTAIPAPFQIIHERAEPSLMRIDNADPQLASLAVGDIIEGAGTRWSIQSIKLVGSYYEAVVAPAIIGTPNGLQDFVFETVVPTPITVLVDPDYWLSNPDVESSYAIDGVDFITTQDAYGADILIQQMQLSPDWDLLALTGGSAGSGGGFATYYESPGITPVTVTEANSPLKITELVKTNPIPGRYRVSLGIIPQFLQANDRLYWELRGSFPSSTEFLHEAKEAGERTPWYYSFSIDITGDFNMEIWARTAGPGAADVVMSVADIYMTRIS